MAEGRVAVIDIGSNSIRLVAYQDGGRAPLPLFNEKVMCGLGRGLAATGLLDPEGVRLALDNLVRFRGLVDAMGIGTVHVLATAAVRDAANGADFARAVQERAHFTIRIISGEEEARLSAWGVLSGIPEADGLVGDLGGGSLELVDIRGGGAGDHATLPLGPLRLADLSGGDLRETRRIVRAELARLPWIRNLRDREFYAVGGSWRSLARVMMDRLDYPLHVIHHYSVNTHDALRLLEAMIRLPRDKVRRLPAVSRRRADSLPLAALTLFEVLRQAPPSRLVFSANGLREGCLYDQLPPSERRSDPLEMALAAIAGGGRFQFSVEQLKQFLKPVLEDFSAQALRLTRAACQLSDIAWVEHPDYRARHAYERALHLPVTGIDHPGRGFLALALCARYGGPLEGPEVAVARRVAGDELSRQAVRVGLGLRLAFTLSGGATSVLTDSALVVEPDTLRLSIGSSGVMLAGDALDRRVDALAKTMDRQGQVMVVERAPSAPPAIPAEPLSGT
ncbi:MAG: exopolyphosphatase [Alphaproteobacteria bacterium]|nr:MAG: exopolyphosphatase [Alphaproteobacteria bacterium]